MIVAGVRRGGGTIVGAVQEAFILVNRFKKLKRAEQLARSQEGSSASNFSPVTTTSPVEDVNKTTISSYTDTPLDSSSHEGDVLLLTKPLGVGILMTAAKGGLLDKMLLQNLYEQMAQLNKTACQIMLSYDIHSCTDVTGFGLLGHAYEMARGSGTTIHILAEDVPYYREAHDMASMGFVPAGAYRNRAFAEKHVRIVGNIDVPTMDIFYDPQTSGGLLIAVAEKDAEKLYQSLTQHLPCVRYIGYVTKKDDAAIIVE